MSKALQDLLRVRQCPVWNMSKDMASDEYTWSNPAISWHDRIWIAYALGIDRRLILWTVAQTLRPCLDVIDPNVL